MRRNFAAFLLVLLSLLSPIGCNYLRTFPLYSELHVAHPDFIALQYLDDPRWWDYATLSSIRQSVADYIISHPNLRPDISESLRHLTIRKGMDTEQVLAVLGPPKKRQTLADAMEIWTYDGRKGGVRSWYYSWGKLQFNRGILMDIEVEYIK